MTSKQLLALQEGQGGSIVFTTKDGLVLRCDNAILALRQSRKSQDTLEKQGDSYVVCHVSDLAELHFLLDEAKITLL